MFLLLFVVSCVYLQSLWIFKFLFVRGIFEGFDVTAIQRIMYHRIQLIWNEQKSFYCQSIKHRVIICLPDIFLFHRYKAQWILHTQATSIPTGMTAGTATEIRTEKLPNQSFIMNIDTVLLSNTDERACAFQLR